MSSSQNRTQTRSIRRRLVTRVIWAKIGVSFGQDVLIFFLFFACLFGCLEYAKTSEVSFKYHRHMITLMPQEEWEDIEVVGFANFPDNLRPMTYKVYDKRSGEELINFQFQLIFFWAFVIEISFFVIQFVFSFADYPAENKRIASILKPIDDMAAKADEFAKFDFSEDKYHIIEEGISNLEPDETGKIAFGDESLAGIENAINSLIARMREVNKQQARFVNDASHELRTPIAVIQGYANMLARWGREDEKVLDEGITAIQNESENMKHLVEQLLFLARGDAGRTNINLERIGVNSVMKEVYEESLMIDENHIYRFVCPDEELYVMADEGLIKQAVRILVDNSAKYTPAKEEIIIKVSSNDEGKVVLQVQDSGIGMNEENVNHMFERFYRADEARTYNGTGLGLSIAKWIVDKHQGHFEIISRPDIGTRIGIYLPRV